MPLLPMEALGRRNVNVAGPLLLLNLALYLSMLGFASWALNTFVDDIAAGHQEQEYYPPAGSWPRSAGDEATLHFIQSALLAAVLGSVAKAAAVFHARAAWRPQGLAAAAALGTVAWAATALALGLACKEMRAAAAAARGWRIRTLEAITATLTITQLAYVLMLHRAAAADAEAAYDAGGQYEPGCSTAGEPCEPGCSTATEGDEADCQKAQHAQQQHGHHHHHRQGQGGGPSCGVM